MVLEYLLNVIISGYIIFVFITHIIIDQPIKNNMGSVYSD